MTQKIERPNLEQRLAVSMEAAKYQLAGGWNYEAPTGFIWGPQMQHIATLMKDDIEKNGFSVVCEMRGWGQFITMANGDADKAETMLDAMGRHVATCSPFEISMIVAYTMQVEETLAIERRTHMERLETVTQLTNRARAAEDRVRELEAKETARIERQKERLRGQRKDKH